MSWNVFLFASVRVWIPKKNCLKTPLHTKSALQEEILANSFFPSAVIVALLSTMKVKSGKYNV